MNTEEAFNQLKSADITNSIQTLRRWLREGTIKAERSENRKVGFNIDEKDLQRFINERTGRGKDEEIKLLRKKVKNLEKDIYRIEDSHEEDLKILYKQRKENKEEFDRKLEFRNDLVKSQRKTIESQRTMIDMLKEEIDELKKNTNSKFNSDSFNFNNLYNSFDTLTPYKKKLGMSPNTTKADVKNKLREVMSNAHPDRGGNAKVFQYLKAEYDSFRKNN